MKARRKPKPTSTIVRKATIAELEAYYEMRLYHYVAEKDGKALAMGTLNRAGGRLWAWFDVKEGLTARERCAVVWAIIRGLRKIGQPVYVTSGEGVFPRAIDLLRAVGFRTTGEVVHGKQVWVYVHGQDDHADPLSMHAEI